MTHVKVGLCGFSMAMARYPLHFPVVEVQQTFYQPPAVAVLQRWRQAAPDDFEFTIKAWQLVTHAVTSSTYRRLRRTLTEAERAGVGGFRATAIVQEGWARTLECARLLRASAVLFQCPASFRPTPENLKNMEGFFRRIERPSGLRLMWEPRGPAWNDAAKEARRLCRELELVHVVDPFVSKVQTRDPTYFRLHGITGSRHVYSDAELRRLMEAVPKTGDTYVMFNNMPRVGDAERFKAMLAPGK